MSRYLLDTNIISNITKPAPSASLLVWMAAQRDFAEVPMIDPLRSGLVDR